MLLPSGLIVIGRHLEQVLDVRRIVQLQPAVHILCLNQFEAVQRIVPHSIGIGHVIDRLFQPPQMLLPRNHHEHGAVFPQHPMVLLATVRRKDGHEHITAAVCHRQMVHTPHGKMPARTALCRCICCTLGNIHSIHLHGKCSLFQRPGHALGIIALAAAGIQQNTAGSAVAHRRFFQRLQQRRIVSRIQKPLSGTHHHSVVSRILGVLPISGKQVDIAAACHIERVPLGTAPTLSPMLHKRTAHRTFPDTHCSSPPAQISAGSAPACAITVTSGCAARMCAARISAAKRSVP